MIRLTIIVALIIGTLSIALAQPTDRLLPIVATQRNQLLDLVAQLEAKLQIANEEIAQLRKENEILKGEKRGP